MKTTEIIETERLRLQAYAPEQLLALLEGIEQFEQRTGLRPAEGLGDHLKSDDVSPEWLAHLRSADGPDPWTLGFAVIHAATQVVIGSAGFKGPPGDEGIVEIAYGIVPGYQGLGYATEAVRAMVDFARREGRVRLVRAHTLPSNGASQRVLAKCGFRFTSEFVDPDDGLVWRWEHAIVQ